MHDIKQWLPYLNDLLGEDEYGQRHVSEVYTLAETINNPKLAVLDRVRLIDWLERLDSTRQVFLLPWIMEQLCNPSPIMCERLLTYFETMLQGEGTDVVQSLGNLFRQKRDYSSKLIKVLNSLSSCLYDQTDVDKDHHLRALPSQRVAAFALATLTGVQNWIDMQPDAVELTELVHDFFEGENEEALRELLKKWLFKGPLFFRYLLVDWSAASGVSLIPDFDVSQTLMRVYRDDTDPLITCLAIQGYASVIPASYLSIASQKISSEIAEFKERAPKWDWWRSAEEATRMVSVGQLRALFTLALKHYPAQEPIDQLLRFLSTCPQQRIGFWKQRNWSRKQWQRVLSASILMFGSRIKIKATASPKQGTVDLGSRIIVHTEDPHGLLAELRGVTPVWLTPVPDPEHPDRPLDWSFQITKLVDTHYCAQDLSALITPSFLWFKQRNLKRVFSKKLQTKTIQEFDVRGDWMSASSEMVTLLVSKALDQGGILDEEQLRELLGFLADMGITTSFWQFAKDPTGKKRNDFKDLLRNLFLNKLADDWVFDFLYPEAEVDPFASQFLAGMAFTALNVIPGSRPSSWISKNRIQLSSIARGNNHIKHRAPAAIALFLRPSQTGNDEATTAALASVRKLDPKKLMQLASGALALLDDKAFSTLVDTQLTPSKGLDLAASPKKLNTEGRVVHLWAELLSRTLIANQYDEKLAHTAALVCLAALLHRGQRALPVSTRMRLLDALSIGSIENSNLQHLLTRLLHDSTSSEFHLYISHLRQQQGKLLDAYHRNLLISMLVDESTKLNWTSQLTKDYMVIDRLTRQRLVLRTLADATKDDQQFFHHYREQRIKAWSVIETNSVVSATGTVLTLPEKTRDRHSLPTVFQAAAGSQLKFETGAMEEVIPCFVSNPRHEAQFSCLVKFRSAPNGTIDFHALDIPNDERRQILARRLRQTKQVTIVGRVIKVSKDENIDVDLGVDLGERMARVQHLHEAVHVKRNDAIIIELRPRKPRQRILKQAFFAQLWAIDVDDNIVDLREHENPIDDLETFWAKKQPVRLRATVKNHIPSKDCGILVGCDCGFKVFYKGDYKYPVARHDGNDELPAIGSEIILPRPTHLSFGDIDMPFDTWPIQSRITQQLRQLAGRELFVTLDSERSEPGQPRHWFAEVGDQRLPIHRRELTSDLRKLFTFDTLSNDHQVLQKLVERPIRSRVVENGKSLSLLQASPEWRYYDIILAVLAGQVDSLTLIGWQAEKRAFLFEANCRNTAMGAEGAPDYNCSVVPLLGGLVLINEGDIYDANGYPLERDAIANGTRCILKVIFATMNSSGHLSVFDEQTLPDRFDATPFLYIVDIDDSDARFRNAFYVDQSVQLRRLDDPERTFEIVDWVEKFPQPLVKIESKTRKGLRSSPPGYEVPALVSHRWDPFADNYELHVDDIESRRLYLPLRPADELEWLLRYFRIAPGFWPMHPKPRFLVNAQKIIRCFVGNFSVMLDPLLQYLAPEHLTQDALNHSTRPLPLRITDVKKRKTRFVNGLEFESIDIPYLNNQTKVYGLVIGVPASRSNVQQIEVRWLPDEPWERSELDDAGTSVYHKVLNKTPRSPKFYNGDVLTISESNGKRKLMKIHRDVFGSLLHEVQSLATWCKDMNSPEMSIIATLIHRPESEQEAWLFVFPCAHLVEILPSQIHNRQLLNDDTVWSLDKIHLRVEKTDLLSPSIDVVNIQLGHLHQAVNKSVELHVTWYDYNNHRFECKFAASGNPDGLPLIPIQLLPCELPPGEDPVRLRKRIQQQAKQRGAIDIRLQCLLSGYSLDIRKTRADDGKDVLTFKLLPEFTTPNAVTGTIREIRQKRSLKHAMERVSRLEQVAGKVVAISSEEIGVLLNHYQHDSPLPLPRSEQCWVYSAQKIIDEGWKGKFTIFRDDDGVLVASLRRNSPTLLSHWLKRRGLATPKLQTEKYPFYCYGTMRTEEISACGIEAAVPDSNGTAKGVDLIMFEYVPGETVVATTRQIKFHGETLVAHGLRHGDVVRRFEVIELSRAAAKDVSTTVDKINDADDESFDEVEYGINVLHYDLDVRYEIEHFSNEQRGVYFGRIRIQADTTTLFEVRGHGYRNQRFGGARLGQWTIYLEPPSTEEIDWLKRQGYEEHAYLKFVRADEAKGQLIFRLATREEVFEQNNLVFVRSISREPYGQSFKLVVAPLDRRLKGKYVISDTLYSIRRGRLAQSRTAIDGIFLAKVDRIDNSWTFLSLIDTPPRQFPYLMKAPEVQVIVNRTTKTCLYVEIEEGVNAEIPKDRIVASYDRIENLAHGDIVFFARDLSEYKLRITEIFPGHIHFLRKSPNATYITQLWSGPKKRIEDWNQKKKRRFKCNLIGYSQLMGKGLISQDSIATKDRSVYQTFQRITTNKKFVELKEGLGSNVLLGMVNINDCNEPYLRFEDGRKRYLTWGETTFREGSAVELSNVLKQISWIDDQNVHNRKTIANTPLIAEENNGNGRASFTQLATWPFPVDYLVAQFAHHDGSGKPDPINHSYVIADKPSQQLIIIEVAPGRFASLPTNLIRLPFASYHPPGLAFSPGNLEQGDEITLQLEPTKANQKDELLPHFRVTSVVFGNGRHFRTGLITCLTKDDNHSALLGHRLPMPSLTQLFNDRVKDLRVLRRPDERIAELRYLAKRYRSRLILKGTVGGSIEFAGGQRVFVDVGIKVPVPGRKHGSDPSFVVHDSSAKFTKGEKIEIRIIEADFDANNNLHSFGCIPFDSSIGTEPSHMVRYRNGSFEICPPHLTVGDVVMVGLQDSGSIRYRVVGFEKFTVRWESDQNDPLTLWKNDIHSQLLKMPQDFLWATVKQIDRRRHVIKLSRRRQLDLLPLESNQIIRGRLLGALDPKHLLVSLAGVPFSLNISQFCYGMPGSIANFARDLGKRDKERGQEMELIWSNGALSAKGPYRLPQPEFDARVELVDRQGLLARGAGFWVFIPISELAYCELDEGLLRKLFPRNQLIRIARLKRNGDQDIYSLVQSADIRSDIEDLKNADGIVYVSRAVQDQERNRMIVCSRSGLLMELGDVGGRDIPLNFCAYVEQLDLAGRRIVLSMEQREIRLWDLPHVDPRYTLDAFTPRIIEERLKQLRNKWREQGQIAFGAWIMAQHDLPPSPRNLRLILETVAELGDNTPPSMANSANQPNELSTIWQNMLGALRKEIDPSKIEGVAAFATGYWLLLKGEHVQARPFLTIAVTDTTVGQSFGAQLSLVRAHQLCERPDAAVLLRKLANRVWINALQTLSFPLLEPITSDLMAMELNEWEEAIRKGNQTKVIQIMKKQAAIEGFSARGFAFLISAAILESRFGQELDTWTQNFVRTLHNDQEYGFGSDPHLNVMAAKLCFARGDLEDAWMLLHQIATDYDTPETDMATFWKSWLSGTEHDDDAFGNSLLSKLMDIFHDCRWKDASCLDDFSALWEEFRTSRGDWSLLQPVYSAVSKPPESNRDLVEWAKAQWDLGELV